MFWSIRKACCCTARHRRRVQDRDGGLALLATLFGLFPFSGNCSPTYQGPVFHRALAGILPDLETEIVKRSDRVKGFVVQPRRWVVERTSPGSTAEPTGKDWENLNRNALGIKRVQSTHAPKTL